ncbi:tail fiber protein [Paenibacillus amylolyticus]|uniref:tail fiber protein n=1 Tax=Paenibacillus amylolyticus TaxID=1451 RepID=UPI001F02988E|nr:phage tail protein [Paenibacillus amylolyticus]
MPQETDRLKLPLPLGNETVSRESINAVFEKIDAGVATQADLDALREAVSKMDIPDASLTQKGKVQLSNATESTSQTLAATSKAVNDARQAAENNAKGASLPRSGGALTGRVDFQTWGSFSADAGGSVLYGSNCYLDPSGSPRTFRYTNTHANLGARGIYMLYTGSPTSAVEIYEFDTGTVASTAGAAFTPVLKRLANTDDFMQPNDNPTTNLIWNSTGLFGLEGWANAGAYPISTSSSPDITSFFYTNDAVPKNQYAVLDSANISVYPSANYDLQAMFFSLNSYPDTIVHIEVKNVANSETLFALAADPQKWWHRKKLSFTTPAGVNQIKLRLVVTNAPANQTKGFARIGLNLRNVANKDVPYDFTGDMAYMASALQSVKQSGVNAKQAVVDAISAKGGSASTNDTWATLAAKINAIQQGNYQSTLLTSYGAWVTTPNVGSITWYETAISFPAGTKLISLASNEGNDARPMKGYIGTGSVSNSQAGVGIRDSAGLIWNITGVTAFTTYLTSLTVDTVTGMAYARDTSESGNSSATSYGSMRVTACPSGFNLAGPLQLGWIYRGWSSNTDTGYVNFNYRNIRVVSM